ncbi:serine/threonine-protein kinase [Streptomyces sp. NPDC057011]|uniref:serine/threonine-protein kinase n=1 Tax=unclassified Streptomyces TaxID=2593676 RepID=UPI0036279F73
MDELGPGFSGPKRVGPFDVLGVLGQGGMGRVLLAAGPDGRLVAVKQVLAHFADDEGFRARFRREVTASRKVAGAYTAAVIDADADAATPWLASVFVAGPSLGAVVEAVGVLPEDVVRRLAAGLASALVEIHRAGLVHRDLKPDNVLLAEDGVRVIDLGIARVTEGEAEAEGDSGLTRTGWVVGSPAYMSPEQAEGKPLTGASDVFSLGSVLVMAVTGRSPFAGSSALRMLYEVVHGEPDLSGVPAGLREVVAACLAKDPADRPSPERLRELIGAVAPAGRQWPSAVYGMLAEQRAGIDRLVDGRPAGAAPLPGASPRTPAPQTPAGLDVPPAAPQTPTGLDLAGLDVRPAGLDLAGLDVRPAGLDLAGPDVRPAGLDLAGPDAPLPDAGSAGSGRRRGWRVAAVVAAGVLVVGGTGVALYVRERAVAPVAYTGVPACNAASGKVSLAFGAPARDTRSETVTEVLASCNWDGLHTAASPAGQVRWDLSRGGDADANAATQKRRFQVEQIGQRDAPRLGFGTEAFWGSPGADWSCVLSVREGNLSVWVGLQAKPYAKGDCETKAKEVARGALKAASR